MFFWNKRKKRTAEDNDVIISPDCYRKLPTLARRNFSPALPHHTEITHEVRYRSTGPNETGNDDFGLSALATAVIVDEALNYIDSSQLSGSSFPGNDGFQGFEGGNGGGAGATGDWDNSTSAPDPAPAYESVDTSVQDTQSYDSPSDSSYSDAGSTSSD